MKKKFYLCKICGNLVDLINEGGGTLVCCGEDMELFTVNTVDADYEKHIPVVEVLKEGTEDIMEIKIGSVEHPMIREHYIDFLYVEYTDGGTLIKLDDKPYAKLNVTGKDLVGVYAYCNLHGMWGTSLK